MPFLLLSITKLQNLKAIHNAWRLRLATRGVVINHKTTKFESNSQRYALSSYTTARCYQSQTTKFESNSQQKLIMRLDYFGCYQS